MALIKEITLYQELEDYIHRYGYKNYGKQTLKYAGECEALNIDSQEWNSRNAKNISSANMLIELIVECVKGDTEERANLEFWVNNCNISSIYLILVEKLKIMIKEEILKEEELYELGCSFSTDGKSSNVIKLGLSMLRLSANKKAKDIFRVFSINNEYVFYCIEGMREYEGTNKFIFEVAKISKGYGKYISVSALEPLNDEIKLWSIENGSDNDIYQDKLLRVVLNKVSIEWYTNNIKFTARKFGILAKLLKRLYDFEEGYYNYDLFYEYIIKFHKYGKSFKHLYCVMVIASFVDSYIKNAILEGDNIYKDVEKEVSILKEEIELIQKSDYWLSVIKSEVEKGKEEMVDILKVASVLKFNLTFQNLLISLNREPVNYNIYKYIMEETDENSKKMLISFAQENIESVNEAIKRSEEYDVCKYHILKNMDDMAIEYITYNIENLKCENFLIKEVAIKNLVDNRDILVSSEIEKIKKIYYREEDKEKFIPLISFINDIVNAKDIIEDVEGLKVDPDMQDLYLISTDLEELNFNNIVREKKILEDGRLVYLKEEEHDLINEDAIKVISDNGFRIGCIPKDNCYILRRLLEGNKILYGVIEEIDENSSICNISVYMSRNDIEEEVNDILKMILVEGEGLIS